MKKINKSKQTNKKPTIFVKTYGCMGLVNSTTYLKESRFQYINLVSVFNSYYARQESPKSVKGKG